MTIKPFVDQQDLMEKARTAIAVPNRSLIFTNLNRIFDSWYLVDSSCCQSQQRRDREDTTV